MCESFAQRCRNFPVPAITNANNECIRAVSLRSIGVHFVRCNFGNRTNRVARTGHPFGQENTTGCSESNVESKPGAFAVDADRREVASHGVNVDSVDNHAHLAHSIETGERAVEPELHAKSSLTARCGTRENESVCLLIRAWFPRVVEPFPVPVE